MILDLLFPNRCLNCNTIISKDEIVCGICMNQIEFSHHHYLENNILKERCKLLFPVENAFTLMIFKEEALSQKILHQLKYGNREIIGKTLANWTIEKLDFENQKPDLLINIPLHRKKLNKRGYNQLHLFTETLSKHFEIPYDHTVLKRNFHSKAQALRNKIQRTESQKKFSLDKPINNKHVLIIDDVFTTGNTISEAAWEVLKKGNNKVSILVMALD